MLSKCFGSTAKLTAMAAVLGVAASAMANIPYAQPFETDTADWQTTADGWYGTVTRIASGTGPSGVASAEGSYHALLKAGPPNSYGYGLSTGPYSRSAGIVSTYPGTWAQGVWIYLDSANTQGLTWHEEFWNNPQIADITGAYLQEFSFRPEKESDGTWSMGLFSPPTSGVTKASGFASDQWIMELAVVRKAYDGFMRTESYILDASEGILMEQTSGPTAVANGSVAGNRTGPWFAVWDTAASSQTTGIEIDRNFTDTLIPGDTDLDWDVDLADLSVTSSNFGNTTTLERGYRQGDFTESGFVDLSDLSLLGANWGANEAQGVSGSVAADGGSVPEPATLLLLGAGGLLLAGRRRRS